MSLRDTKRSLQWQVVTEALLAAEVDSDTIALVEQAKAISNMVLMMTEALIVSSDAKQAKNYVKIKMVGLIPPFDRAYVELVRPGGMTSHDLRALLHDRLTHVRSCLLQKEIALEAFREGIVLGIDEDLAKDRAP